MNPDPREVREITEQHAENLVALLDSIASGLLDGRDGLQAQFNAGIAASAEDFGERAARQFEAYVRRQSGLDGVSRRGR